MVDPIGFEPTTSAMSRQRSNQLSYGSVLMKSPQRAQYRHYEFSCFIVNMLL